MKPTRTQNKIFWRTLFIRTPTFFFFFFFWWSDDTTLNDFIFPLYDQRVKSLSVSFDVHQWNYDVYKSSSYIPLMSVKTWWSFPIIPHSWTFVVIIPEWQLSRLRFGSCPKGNIFLRHQFTNDLLPSLGLQRITTDSNTWRIS